MFGEYRFGMPYFGQSGSIDTELDIPGDRLGNMAKSGTQGHMLERTTEPHLNDRTTEIA